MAGAPILMRMRWMRNKTVIAGIIGVFIGFLGGASIMSVYARMQQESFLSGFHSLRLTGKKFPLISPLVAYETPEATTFVEYQQLKTRIQRLINERIAAGGVQSVSIYYRNQEAGDWIGIDQNMLYYPASLLKVPIMIAYFKKAESDPNILQRTIRYVPVTGGDPFEESSSLGLGKWYTIRELIERMIVNSDNGAMYTLIDRFDEAMLNEVYSDLGITHPSGDSSVYQISTKTYALFFRVLFNATYLTPAYSEQALELLARSIFRDGLVSGIPDDIMIAHKFGEHVISENRRTIEGIELHDCGIVYYPDHPYLLCVMTRAKTLDDAKGIIGAISREIYNTIKADIDDGKSPKTGLLR